MSEIKIYNSLTRQKEPLPAGKKLRLFVCGPTVYDDAHIGHARTYIFFDFFAKYLRGAGYKVKYVQNITNIDDKIISRAREEHKDPLKLAADFTERYFEDMRSLGVNAANKYAPATKFIKQIVHQVQTLAKNGYAYEIPGDLPTGQAGGWYFEVGKFGEYGKLSGRTAAQAEDAVSRVDESVDKRGKGDFCLWKFSKMGEPSWKTKLGAGRPGWHIEDTAISEYYFGPQYDIHGGGLDLKFPHHEAEIAQQEAASGKKPFVKLWMHTGFLTVNGEKMSKSLGNFLTIRDYLAKSNPNVLRLAFFGHHYRSPIDYNEKLLQDSARALDRLQWFNYRLDSVKKMNGRKDATIEISSLEKKFHEAFSDDLNTPEALGTIFELERRLNPDIDSRLLNRNSASLAQKYLENAMKLFGIKLSRPEIPSKIMGLVAEREKLRINKQFVQSDVLRKEVESLGYELSDTIDGTMVWLVEHEITEDGKRIFFAIDKENDNETNHRGQNKSSNNKTPSAKP